MIKYTIRWIVVCFLVNPNNKDDRKIINTYHKEQVFYDCDSAYNFYQKAKYCKLSSRYFSDTEIDSVRIDSIKIK
jgi:hypothetical protein